MCTCIEAKRPCWSKTVTVLAIPHERIGDDNVRIGVAYALNWVSSGRCSEVEFTLIGADKNVTIIRAATAFINAKRVVNRNVTAIRSAGAGLSCCEAEKLKGNE